MNNLERDVRSNRKAFDRIEKLNDADSLWERIRKEIPTEETSVPVKPVSIYRRYLQLAAAAVVGLMVGLSLWAFEENKAMVKTDRHSISTYFPNLGEQEKYYQRLVAQKELEIGLKEISPVDYQDIFQELKALDELRNEYFKDLAKVPVDEQLVNTLLRFYEREIQILERLKNEIEKRNNHEERILEKRL